MADSKNPVSAPLADASSHVEYDIPAGAANPLVKQFIDNRVPFREALNPDTGRVLITTNPASTDPLIQIRENQNSVDVSNVPMSAEPAYKAQIEKNLGESGGSYRERFDTALQTASFHINLSGVTEAQPSKPGLSIDETNLNNGLNGLREGKTPPAAPQQPGDAPKAPQHSLPAPGLQQQSKTGGRQ